MQGRQGRWTALAVALAVVATGPVTGCTAVSPTAVSPTAVSPTAVSPTTARPAALVAVTVAGAVDVLDPADGHRLRRLVTSGAAGVARLSPDGATVYYERAGAAPCTDEIWRVPASGGSPALVTRGALPSVSPDGARLAHLSQAVAAGRDGCTGTVTVRDLATGRAAGYPADPQLGRRAADVVVRNLSWRADGAGLAVSYEFYEEPGGVVRLLDLSGDRYSAVAGAAGTVPVAAGAPGSFYSEGVYLPDGHLFVTRQCCAQASRSATLMVVDPADGSAVRTLSTTVPDRAGTGLDADATGHGLLHLSGTDVVVSRDGATPVTLATGYRGADW